MKNGEIDELTAETPAPNTPQLVADNQGLIAVKTAGFGGSVNWTLGLPFVRTSVDHGTAFDIAGRGVANELPLAQAVASTLALLDGSLPIRR